MTTEKQHQAGAVPRSEIGKLPRTRCGRCGLEMPKPIVVDGACTNASACRRRVARTDRERKARKEAP